MTDDRDKTFTRRRPGRPRVEEPLTQVSTRLPPRAYDQLITRANQQGVSVHALLRRQILSWLR